LKTRVLEHTVIVVPLNTDCNITEGGWHSLVSRETGLWPGKPGFILPIWTKTAPPPPHPERLWSPPSLQSNG